jgi:hypothetical protein
MQNIKQGVELEAHLMIATQGYKKQFSPKSPIQIPWDTTQHP